jgi:hypothetical protein
MPIIQSIDILMSILAKITRQYKQQQYCMRALIESEGYEEVSKEFVIRP